MPAVSVVIPTYNGAKYVGEAVDSVLAQSFHDIEVLVIDDGSTDETESVISRFGPAARYIRQENGGVSVARNRGIQESTGRYVAFLDADDTWLPEKLDRQMAALTGSKTCRVCYSAFTVCNETLEPLAIQRSLRKGSTLEDLLLRGNVVGSICSVLCERSLFAATGGFDRTLSQCADWDMWLRLAIVTEFLYLDEPLVTYRQHRSNMSRDAQLLERDSHRVLQRGFGLEGLPSHMRAGRRAAFGRNYMVLAGTYFYAGRYWDFLRCAARSVMLDPRQLGYLGGFPGRALGRFRFGGRPVGQWR